MALLNLITKPKAHPQKELKIGSILFESKRGSCVLCDLRGRDILPSYIHALLRSSELYSFQATVRLFVKTQYRVEDVA